MRIRFLRAVALGGVGNDVYPGDVRSDIPLGQARAFVAAGRAEWVDDIAGDPPPPAATALEAPAQEPRRATLRKPKA